jgi:putative glutathione S-transferase
MRVVRLASSVVLPRRWAQQPNGFAPLSIVAARGMASNIDYTTDRDEGAPSGSFQRKPAVFRDKVSSADGAKYPPEAGRYILYHCYACPWSSRVTALRAMKGLEGAIQVVIVEPVWKPTPQAKGEDEGWGLAAGVDPVFGARSIGEIYDHCTPDGAAATEIYSVPLFVDRKTKTIVNNESSDIVRFVNSEFNSVAKRPQVDIYPEAKREEIDHMNDSIYETVNNGVYKCGFAESQEAYDQAVNALFKRLGELEELLSRQRFLISGSNAPTESDLRLFMTLIRFDEVYHVHFKANKKSIHEYPNLHGWLRDMWQWDNGVLQPTVNMEHIKQHYYGSHKTLNPYGTIPVGPGALARLNEPHGRETIQSQL